MASIDAFVQKHDYPCWCGQREARLVCKQMFGNHRFAVLECASCTTHRILPKALTEQAAAAELYNEYELGGVADPSEANTAARMLRRFEQVKLELDHRRSVLDVGCGAGAILDAVCRHHGCTGKGIDVDARRIARAKTLRKNGDYECGLFDGNRVPRKYDVVLCTAVIEHVVDPVDFIRNLVAAMAPGGSLFLLTPNAACLTYRVLGSWWRDLLSIGEHIYLFTPGSLDRCGKQAGVRMVEVATGFDFAPFQFKARSIKQVLISFWWLYREGVRHVCRAFAPPLGRDILYAHFKRTE